MLNLLDLHTHTISSGHAYTTLLENIAAAKRKGLKILGVSRSGYIAFKKSRILTNSILKVVLPLIPNSLQSVIISQVGLFFIEF